MTTLTLAILLDPKLSKGFPEGNFWRNSHKQTVIDNMLTMGDREASVSAADGAMQIVVDGINKLIELEHPSVVPIKEWLDASYPEAQH